MSRVLISLLLLAVLVIAWQSARIAFPEHERAVRSQVKATVESTFPEEAAKARSRFGLTWLHRAGPGLPEIVLVHGLDDPGMVLSLIHI